MDLIWIGGDMGKNILTFAFLFAFTFSAAAETAKGVFRTEANDSGAFLEVKFGSCKKDDQLSCATILKAYKSENDINESYEHLGKLIVEDMENIGNGKFKGGTIWDPSEDKTYASKMNFSGKDMNVEGCILFFCRAQLWKRVE